MVEWDIMLLVCIDGYFLNFSFKHGKCHILTLFCMTHANIFKIEPEISAKVACEIFFYFTYPIDVNVTLHTLKLKIALNMKLI